MFYMRDAICLRYTLAPYIYNAARQNFDTGIGMCRPLYYEYPETEEAYNNPEEFLFGDDILATAITQPVDSLSGLAARKIWFPEGSRWYDCATGAMYDGGTSRTLHYTVGENPWYARAGAILPMNPDGVQNLQQPCDTLVLTFIPGGDGELRYYEDDGISQRYTTEFATTRITKRQEGAVIRAEIAAREGSYAGAPATRSYELRFPATFPPQRVTVNGVEIPYSRFPKAGEWTYDAYTLAPVIYTEAVACDRPLTVELTLDAAALPKQEALYGKSGIFKRCLDLTVEFKLEQGGHGEPYLLLPKEYLRISQCPNFILERPELTVELISQFDETLAKMFETTDKMELLGPDFKEKLHRQLGGEE